MVLDRLTDNQSGKTQKDFIDFFDANWTEEVVRDLYTAQKGKGRGGKAAPAPPVAVPRMQLEACVHVCCFPGGYQPTHRLADLASTSEAGSFASRVYMTYGVHPHSASQYDDALEKEIEQAMSHPRTVAWGECGLDFFKNLSEQERYFAELFILNRSHFADNQHCHNEQDTLRLLKEHVPTEWKIHMHCFGESPEMAGELLALYPNVYFGFTGAITFAKAGRAPEVVKMVAELKGTSLAEVIRATTENARTVYSLPKRE
ncbi:hydrolase, TatD family protein [Acanthamoeba castellanii str. Neff]|uniref:Hydrolase, TatD family protein n=1 Tax=Acanthamoeba castellanii (strain ATCC 30010 / Neff) TaxID=1257118 RepID=L8GSE5_ACACF|nr:hydrolase, TatD family protein [Acanthamoeba castellanii str. Neff]ELR15523.1 hydrolase, TatD family protein [Acanthamoeba castellanii str. Neff]